MTEKRILELAYCGAVAEFGEANRRLKAFPNKINATKEKQAYEELKEISSKLYVISQNENI